MRRVFQGVITQNLTLRPAPGTIWKIHYASMRVTQSSAGTGMDYMSVFLPGGEQLLIGSLDLTQTGTLYFSVGFSGHSQTGGTGSVANVYTRPIEIGEDAEIGIEVGTLGSGAEAYYTIQVVEEGV